ncbi:hypothetical protein T08_16194 [Trichinella sp. T8]|nr:hypothetical protein T08_16194 [Trichinella sp. T8]
MAILVEWEHLKLINCLKLQFIAKSWSVCKRI